MNFDYYLGNFFCLLRPERYKKKHKIQPSERQKSWELIFDNLTQVSAKHSDC